MKNPSDNISYRHTLPIQLRFGDFDRFGHVNNVVYFQFYDLGNNLLMFTVARNGTIAVREDLLS